MAQQWAQYAQVGFSLSVLVTAGFYGTLSDRLGRRVAIMAPVIGNGFIAAVGLALSGGTVPVPNWRAWVVGSNVVGGLAGGTTIALMSCFAYVADTHRERRRQRSVSLVLVEAAYGVGAFGSLLSSGYLTKAYGTSVTFAALCGVAILLVLVTYLIPESLVRTDGPRAVRMWPACLDAFCVLGVLRRSRRSGMATAALVRLPLWLTVPGSSALCSACA